MRTPEEILNEAAIKHFDNQAMDYRALSNGVKVGNIKQRELEAVRDAAMSLYAREVAVEFGEWKREKGYEYDEVVKCYVEYDENERDHYVCDDEAQLFDLFMHTNGSKGEGV